MPTRPEPRHPPLRRLVLALAGGVLGAGLACAAAAAGQGDMTTVNNAMARLQALLDVPQVPALSATALLDGVIAFNGAGRLLGPLSETTRARILQQGARLDGRVELRLALDILATEAPGAADLARARGYLAVAAGSRTPGVSATAQTVLAGLEDRTKEAGTITN